MSSSSSSDSVLFTTPKLCVRCGACVNLEGGAEPYLVFPENCGCAALHWKCAMQDPQYTAQFLAGGGTNALVPPPGGGGGSGDTLATVLYLRQRSGGVGGGNPNSSEPPMRMPIQDPFASLRSTKVVAMPPAPPSGFPGYRQCVQQYKMQLPQIVATYPHVTVADLFLTGFGRDDFRAFCQAAHGSEFINWCIQRGLTQELLRQYNFSDLLQPTDFYSVPALNRQQQQR